MGPNGAILGLSGGLYGRFWVPGQGDPRWDPIWDPERLGLESGKRLVYVGIPPQLPPSSVAKEARKLATFKGSGSPTTAKPESSDSSSL